MKLALPFQKVITLIILFCITTNGKAQLANDRCENATVMSLGLNSAQCTPIAGTTIGAEDATLIEGPMVCSGSWYSDDVWFQFSTDANPPEYGITIESILGEGDVPELGMAIYAGCDPDDEPFDCFSSSPGRRTLMVEEHCVEPNTTYYVRCWSTGDPAGGAPNLYAGTFSICAYGADAPEINTDVVIWSEDFFDGPGGFTSVAFPESNFPDCIYNWEWNENGTFLTYGNTAAGQIRLPSAACNGAMGFQAGFFQTRCTGLVSNVPEGPFMSFASQLISPSIDLSTNDCVSVKWKEYFRGLNPAANSSWGSYFEYSIDGGVEWIGIDLNENDDRNIEYIREREFPLPGAGGQPDVRLRFTFDGDFYWWIIDNIRIIERRDNDMSAQENFYAIAPLSTMPIAQIDEVRFMIDILNRGCDTQTNTIVNCTCVDDNSGMEVYNEDLSYGDIISDSLAQNKAFMGRFTPAAEVVTTYTCTYTVSADAIEEHPVDNSQTFTFEVSDELQFRKEEGRTRGLSPLATTYWEEGEPHYWEIGNVFYTTSDHEHELWWYNFNSIDFQVDNPDILAGEQIVAWLYQISDNNFDGIIDKNDLTELQRLGVGEYTFTGFEAAEDLITVELQYFNNFNDLKLIPKTHYYAAIEFPTTSLDVNMFIAASDEFDYSASMYMTRTQTDPEITPPSSVSDIRYSHGFSIGPDGPIRLTPNSNPDLSNFGDHIVPVIRLNLGEGHADIIDSADDPKDQLSEIIDIEILPSPASVEINLNVDIAETTNKLTVQIVDISGKVVLMKAYENVKSLKENYNISTLSDGVYFMHINTTQGIQTKSFVVAK